MSLCLVTSLSFAVQNSIKSITATKFHILTAFYFKIVLIALFFQVLINCFVFPVKNDTITLGLRARPHLDGRNASPIRRRRQHRQQVRKDVARNRIGHRKARHLRDASKRRPVQGSRASSEVRPVDFGRHSKHFVGWNRRSGCVDDRSGSHSNQTRTNRAR